MEFYEKFYIEQGYKIIAGLDEVGRGPLAGPVCAAAVILKYPLSESIIQTVRDSKALSEVKREDICKIINENALGTSIATIDEKIIDKINILAATKLAMVTAVRDLCRQINPDFLLIDGNFSIDAPFKQKSIIKGDASCYSIAAASIIAKVYRDKIMNEFHEKYPVYNFKSNKGYGTAEHLSAIKKYGPAPIHRMTFKGVK